MEVRERLFYLVKLLDRGHFIFIFIFLHEETFVAYLLCEYHLSTLTCFFFFYLNWNRIYLKM